MPLTEADAETRGGVGGEKDRKKIQQQQQEVSGAAAVR